MKKLLELLVISLAAFVGLSVPSAHAGTEVGNGGNAVVCRDSNAEISTIELLDYYEARIIRQIPLSLGKDDLRYKDVIRLVLDRMARLSPSRAKYYQTLADQFEANAKFISNIVLASTEDSFEVAVPKGCFIEQLAVQKEPLFPEDRLYTINKDLWDAMTERDKAGLVLHEISYREALFHGQKDSRKARYFNSIISSARMESMDARGFADLVALVGFHSAEYKGFQFEANTLVYAFDKSDQVDAKAAVLDVHDADVFYPFPPYPNLFPLKLEWRALNGGNLTLTEPPLQPAINSLTLYPTGNFKRVDFLAPSGTLALYIIVEVEDRPTLQPTRIMFSCMATECFIRSDEFTGMSTFLSLLIPGHSELELYSQGPWLALSYDTQGELSAAEGTLCRFAGKPIQFGSSSKVAPVELPCWPLEGGIEDPVQIIQKSGEIVGRAQQLDSDFMRVKSLYPNGMPMEAEVIRDKTYLRFANGNFAPLPRGAIVTFSPENLVTSYQRP